MSKARHVTVTMFLSLDGVAQGPGSPDEDRGGGFEQGGWAFASHWPLVTDPADLVAAALNGRPKYVVSKTLDRADWRGATLLRGDPEKEIADLKQTEGEIQVHGSIELARWLFAREPVDTCHLWTFPVVLGSGRRLFGPGAVPAALTHVATRTTGRGVVVSSYRLTGRPSYATYGLETVGEEGNAGT